MELAEGVQVADNNNNCSNCNTALHVGANYCHSCGTPIAGTLVPGSTGNSRNFLIGGGIVAALALAGGGYYVLTGGPVPAGPNFDAIGPGLGQADSDGDGEISFAEFGQELSQLKMPTPGRWSYTIGGAAPDADSESNYIRYSGEAEFCDLRDVREMEDAFEEMRDPDNFEEMEREFRAFSGNNDSEMEIDHFTIDGDNVALRVSGSGEERNFLMSMSGTGDFAVLGTFGEERIELQSPIFLDMEMSGPAMDIEGEMEIRINAVYLLEADRIGDCPDGWDDPVLEEEDDDFPAPMRIVVPPPPET